MASKKSTPLDDPPSASSESSEYETEDEQEQQEIITQKSIPQQTTSTSELETSESDESDEETPEPKIQTPVPKPPPSSSESESSESGSESESEQKASHKASIFEFESDIKSPSASDFAIKPSKKIKTFQAPGKNPTLKRHIPGPSDNNKKSKNFSNGDVEDEKKAVIKRVWSEDDEILLLQGFIEYQLKNGYSPLSDMDGFYRFSMDNLPGNATKSQLYEKVRRLKKKFRVNAEKIGPNGKDPVFVKPHDAKIFEISKKIWGVDGCETGANFKAKTPVPKPKAAPKVKTPVKVKAKVEEKVDEVMEDDDEVMEDKVEDFETLYPYWNAGLINEVLTSLKFPAGAVELVKENMSFIGDAKAKEMDEKWKVLLEDEARLRRKRIALLSKVGYVET